LGDFLRVSKKVLHVSNGLPIASQDDVALEKSRGAGFRSRWNIHEQHSRLSWRP
jgi:hypothetical protein